jgi:bifunctional UDP-N-acetylglucosamine pyrophosphorylase / glucosamine-1-phosphate N-acetyltransferase
MTHAPLACLILAGGKGTRMKSEQPKLLHELCGRSLLGWTLAAVAELAPDPVVAVVPAGESAVAASLPDWVRPAVQEQPLGTGDAARSGRQALAGFAGDVLVLNGDHPLTDPASLRDLVAGHRAAGAAASVLTFDRTPSIGGDFGRVVRAADGNVQRIVEAGDASDEERALTEVNSGIYVFDAGLLWPALDRLESANRQGELYLTDVVAVLHGEGRLVAAHRHDDATVALGVNTRADLAEAGAILRARIAHEHMLAGVTIVDPATTYIDASVRIEPDAVVHPFTILQGDSLLQRGCVVGPNAVVVDSRIGPGVEVGPFCLLRPGTVLEAGAHAGHFVEIKNARIGEGAKVPHLSYIGDAEIGAQTNIGAGAITANYDGHQKQRTVIGRDVHTGSDNVFVAPVTIGDGAWTAAGSIITDDVPPDALAVARARQKNIEGYGKRKRR